MTQKSYQAQFEEFHLANPEVYEELVRLCREAKSYGLEQVGIRMLWEVARWNLNVVTKRNSPFKLNDHYHSRYARMIMIMEHDLDGIFELRKLST
jgi:hypothetical protein